MWYLYDDGQYVVAQRLGPQTEGDLIMGPLTLEEAREWARLSPRTVIWR